jgi:uncharacterized protein YhaN
MRINKIDFIAFGPFTDLTLDFACDNGCLDIVYGNNEAGKSAALRGIKALLYGIEERTSDNFIHDNKDLRIGGLIARSSGSSLAFIRRKGRANTLLNYDGTTIKDDLLKEFLGNTSEELFIRLFGINHDELINGGRSIVQGHGDVGESLFGAGMGKINLHEIIKGIESEADELFKPRGKKNRISEAIASYNNAKKEALQNELSGDLWIEHKERLKEATTKSNHLIEELQTLRKEYSHLERINNSLPSIAKLKEDSNELALMGEVIMLPPDFSDIRKKLIHDRQHDREVSEDAKKQLNDLRGELLKITIPEGILKSADKISELYKRLGSYQKAEKDSKGLKAQIEQLNAEVLKILSEIRPELSIESAESIRLTKLKRTKIRDTAHKFTSFVSSHKEKEKTLKFIDSDLAKIKASLESIEKPTDLKVLKNTLKTLQTNINLEDEFQMARMKHQQEIKNTSNAFKKLNLLNIQLEELETIKVPMNETIDKFDSDFEELNNKIRLITEKINITNEKIKALDIEINAIEHAGYIPSETDLTTTRQWRQKGWELILGEWLHKKHNNKGVKEFAQDKPLYIAYEESVAKADDIADRLRREADSVAKKARLHIEINRLKEEKIKLEEEKDIHIKLINNLQKEWEDIWMSACVKPLTPREMRAWLNSYRHVMERLEGINSYRDRIEELESKIQLIRKEAMDNLKLTGLSIEDDSIFLKGLLKITDSHFDRTEKTIKEIERLKDKLVELSRQKEKEIADIQSIEQDISVLRPEWSKMLDDLGLSAMATLPEVDAYLEVERELFDKIDKVKELQKRIEGINKDAAEFIKDVNKLTIQISSDLKDVGGEQAVIELNSRLQKAKEDSVRLEQVMKQIKVKEDLLNKTDRNIENITVNLKNMCQMAKCSDEGRLEEIENKSEKARKLKERIEQTRNHLLNYCGNLSLDEFIKEAEGEDIDSIDSRMHDIAQKISINETKLSEIDRMIGESENELKRMSGDANTAEAVEKAEGILAGIRNDTERYLKLCLASAILNYEIERYRQRNQSPLLKRAGEIFSQLTLNSFSTILIIYTYRK